MNFLKSIVRIIIPKEPEVRMRRLELTFWAFLLSLAYYSLGLGFIAWFALVRPIMIISKLDGRTAFSSAFLFGYLFNLFTIYWVAMVTPPGMVVAVALMASYYAIGLFTFNRLYKLRPIFGIIALPILWTGIEYFRTLTEVAFPWSDLGYTQADYLYILQIVSVISVHGLSFLIVTVNVIIWQIFRSTVSAERKVTASFASLAIVIALLAFGWICLPPYPIDGTYRIGLLQGSVSLQDKLAGSPQVSFDIYDSLTQSISDENVQLFVWPETSAPTYLSHSRVDRKIIGDIVSKSGAYHLVGALGAGWHSGKQVAYNSCYQFSPTGRFQTRYDKVKLVPFSEQVPYQDELPFLRKEFLTQYLTFIETYNVQWWSDFRPGDSLVIFEADSVLYMVAICFESTFPEYIREGIRRGAHFVVGITNDTWFGESVGTYMHSRIFRTRAVENRCWMVRAANSGISYFVDQYGRLRQELPISQQGVLVGNVGLLEEYSLFTRWGDFTGLLSFLLSLGLIAILFVLWLIGKLRSN